MSVDSRTPAPGPSAVPGLAAGSGPLADRLQGLLAQAVGDQLAERRLIAEALAELGGRVESTAGIAREAHAELAGTVSTNLVLHSATVARLGDTVRALPDALAELRAEVARLGERVAGLVVPTASQQAAVMAPQVADRLAAALVPAVAEAVRRHVEPLLQEALLRRESDARPRPQEPAGPEPAGREQPPDAAPVVPPPGPGAVPAAAERIVDDPAGPELLELPPAAERPATGDLGSHAESARPGQPAQHREVDQERTSAPRRRWWSLVDS